TRHLVTISLPCCVVVSAHVSLSERKPAPRWPTSSSTLSRSRVERARRSRRTTINTSPGSSRRMIFASSGRSVLAPEIFSLNTLAQPAAISSLSCASKPDHGSRPAPRALYPLHRYYEAVRPSPAHRYFRPRGWSRLHLFPCHRRPGSHVPYKSLVELRVLYMPDAARAVSCHPPILLLFEIDHDARGLPGGGVP